MSDPSHIGPYRVLRVLGEGGMGRVYLAHDEGLDRAVAIKVLRDDVAVDPDSSARFLREARAMARLSSPHVVTIHQVAQMDGATGSIPYLVMEVLDGEDLAKTIEREGALPVHRVARYGAEAAAGLQAAAAAGIVHRDVKPANLLLTTGGDGLGHIKLTDFGLARPLDGSSDLTQEGIVVGSPFWLAPELIRGVAATHASDVYSLGATLFEALTGVVPYERETPVAVVLAHAQDPIPPVDGKLGPLVRRMLAKDPAERPSLEVVEQELRRFATTQADSFVAALPATAATEAQMPAASETLIGHQVSARNPSRRPAATLDAGVGPSLPANHATEAIAGIPALVDAPTPTAAATPPSRASGSNGKPPLILLAVVGIVGMVGVIGVLIIGALVVGGGGRDISRIDRGEAKAVWAEQKALNESSRDFLLAGHAAFELGKKKQAARAYLQAVKKRDVDDRAMNNLVQLLSGARKNSVEALTQWPHSDVVARLQRELGNERWDTRHGAAAVLTARGHGKKVDEEQMAILDLKSASTCSYRQMGLRKLMRVGKTIEALRAVEAASSRQPMNLCMLAQFSSVETAIRTRLASK